MDYFQFIIWLLKIPYTDTLQMDLYFNIFNYLIWEGGGGGCEHM